MRRNPSKIRRRWSQFRLFALLSGLVELTCKPEQITTLLMSSEILKQAPAHTGCQTWTESTCIAMTMSPQWPDAAYLVLLFCHECICASDNKWVDCSIHFIGCADSLLCLPKIAVKSHSWRSMYGVRENLHLTRTRVIL